MRGQVLLTVALALPVLLGMAGMAVDMGRLYVAKARLQAAVDAAALAGSRRLMDDPDLERGLVADAVAEYLHRNYPEAYLVDLSRGQEARSIHITARAEVPLTFMAALGFDSRTVEASASAGFDNLEIALVIDNTGSMEGEPIETTKQALDKLVELLIPEERSSSIKVGLVPFRGKVHVGDGADGLPPGCRNADGTLNTAGPAENCFEAIPPILPLSNDKARIDGAIAKMTAPREFWASSGTIIAEGVKWGRYVLTPDPPYSQASPPGMARKVMILLTDGDNEDGTCGGDPQYNPLTHPNSPFNWNAYFGQNPPVKTCNCDDYGCLDQAMVHEAQLAKEAGIEIFVVRFGDSDAVDIELLKKMASSTPGTDDHYFDAPTVDDMEVIFHRIARRLGVRLIS